MDTSNAVVLITSSNPKNSNFGTGFVVHKQGSESFIVTCAHVINDVGKDSIQINKSHSASLFAELVEGIDLAILKTEDLDAEVVKIGGFVSKDSETIIVGYSFVSENIHTCREIKCTLDKETTSFTNQPVKTWDLGVVDTSPLAKGYSGAPVLQSGKVVGVANYGHYDGRKGSAVSIFELKKISRHNILKRLFPELVQTELTIGFTNRDEERKRLAYVSGAPTLYFVIDAPAGYGKSTLLRQLQKEYNAKKWAYSLVQVSEESNIEDLDVALHTNFELDGQNLTLTRNRFSSGTTLGRSLVSRFQSELPDGRGIVILIDLDKKPNEQLTENLFSEFIPNLFQTLERLETMKQRILKLYVIVAGRSLIATADNYRKTLSLSYIPLSPFKFEDIYSSAKDHFGIGITDDFLKAVAGLAMCLGAGHPGCMSHIFHHFKEECDVSENDCLEQHGLYLWNRYISDYATQVCDQMGSIVENPEIYYLLSLFRYVDDHILDEIVNQYGPGTIRDGSELGDKLVNSYLFQRRTNLGLIGDSIVRRLMAMNLCLSEPARFLDLCHRAQELCKNNLSSTLSNSNFWVIEFLFQCLQEYMGIRLNKIVTRGVSEIEKSERFHFFVNTKLPEIIEALNGVFHKQSTDKDGTFSRRARGKQLLQMLKDPEQWEFRFVLNYHFGNNAHDDTPFQDVLSNLQTLLLNGESNDV